MNGTRCKIATRASQSLTAAAVLLAALLAPATLLCAQAQPPVLTLSQCVQTALAQGAQARILASNLEAARAENDLVTSRNSLSLNGSLGYAAATPPFGNTAPPQSFQSGSRGAQAGLAVAGPLTSVDLNTAPYLPPPAAGGSPSSSAALSVSQTVWDGYPGGTGRAAVQKSRLTLEGAQITADTGRLGFLYSVKQAYYTMLAAQQKLVVLQQALDQQNAVLRQIQAVYDLKQASQVDLQSAQINARSAEIDLESGRQALGIARIRLANLIGRPVDQEFSVADTGGPSPPAFTLQEAIAQGLKQRQEVTQVELQRRALTIDRALLKAQRSPTVSLNGEVSWTVDWTGANAGVATAGVKIALPLLDAGAAAHQEQANRQQDAAYAARELQLRAGISADIEDAYQSVQIQQQRLDLASLRARNASQLLELARTRYRYGTATAQDLLDAAVASADAADALAQARSNLQLAVLGLENAMGR